MNCQLIWRGFNNSYFLRLLHCRTLGQIKHSSLVPGGVFSSPLKCAHLAGESRTMGYSVALTPTILSFVVSNSKRDIQNGQAKWVCRGITESSVIIVGLSKCFSHPL